jgi:hypothetical protein
MCTLRRFLTAPLLAIVFLAAISAPTASADQIPINGNASPSLSGNGTDQNVQFGSGGSGKGGGGGGGLCDYLMIPADDTGYPSVLNGGVTDSGQVIPPGTPGTWYVCYVYNNQLDLPGSVVFVPQGGAVSPAQLLLTARNHLALPAPPIQMSPASDLWQYVQMPTWAWVPNSAWVPQKTSLSAGPVTVTVIATPIRLVFNYQVSGNGTTAAATCKGPGTPFTDQLAISENPQQPVLAASPDCGWTWHQSSADSPDQKYAIRAHTVYHVVWTVQGAPGGGDLGELNGFDATARVTVGEIQALNTPQR